MKELLFKLLPDDDWPPVSVEGIYVEENKGYFEILNAPFFIKDLSVGDQIIIKEEESEQIVEWEHLHKSKNSNVWIMVHAEKLFSEICSRVTRVANIGHPTFNYLKINKISSNV